MRFFLVIHLRSIISLLNFQQQKPQFSQGGESVSMKPQREEILQEPLPMRMQPFLPPGQVAILNDLPITPFRPAPQSERNIAED